MIINDFMEIGYDVDYQLINTADYGIPQLRQRVFIKGNMIGAKNIFPEKTYMDFTEEHKEQLKNIYHLLKLFLLDLYRYLYYHFVH